MLEILRAGPVVPVVTLEDAAAAVPLARALLAGGVRVIEVTLRTPVALAAIDAIRRAVPEATVGAGTLLAPADLVRARDAGAQFGVSPGATPALLDAARGSHWPFLPGAATPSDMLAALAAGFTALKFFPAEASGGIPALAALRDALPQLTFCPTGGISPATAPGYLALRNVACVGGSWLAPAATLRAGDWPAITRLARQASALRRPA